jgi:hypothetical protein
LFSYPAAGLAVAIYGALVATVSVLIAYRGYLRTGSNISLEVKVGLPWVIHLVVRNKGTVPVSIETIVADVVDRPGTSSERRLCVSVQTQETHSNPPDLPFQLAGQSSVKWTLSDNKKSHFGLPGLTSRYGQLLGHGAWRPLNKDEQEKFIESHIGMRLGTGRLIYGGSRWLRPYHWSTWAIGMASLYATACLVAFVIPWPLAFFVIAGLLTLAIVKTKEGHAYRKQHISQRK